MKPHAEKSHKNAVDITCIASESSKKTSYPNPKARDLRKETSSKSYFSSRPIARCSTLHRNNGQKKAKRRIFGIQSPYSANNDDHLRHDCQLYFLNRIYNKK
jgi:hypothetical protein